MSLISVESIGKCGPLWGPLYYYLNLGYFGVWFIWIVSGQGPNTKKQGMQATKVCVVGSRESFPNWINISIDYRHLATLTTITRQGHVNLVQTSMLMGGLPITNCLNDMGRSTYIHVQATLLQYGDMSVHYCLHQSYRVNLETFKALFVKNKRDTP